MGNLLTNISLGKVAISFIHTLKAMELFFTVVFSVLLLSEERAKPGQEAVNLFSVMTIISFFLLIPFALLLEGFKLTPENLQIDVRKTITIIVLVISSVVVLTVALISVLYAKKRRYIQQKRKEMVKILNDSSLNSTSEKATGNWDEANKLGQGGFGSVYKVIPYKADA
ncbi:hypothetical protein L1987_35471 [Smallanthus sonchifolius]|uniref:Uncharacterized protein n=1 Tax=Smallanthus sonchifolius TaxID=185202 RepID=A0ACB9HXX1_9ASTR|nr:hypothetical protein L1987_35471 [Smallanthus sonchifolius]